MAKKLLSRQMKQEETRTSAVTRDFLSRHRLLQHEKVGIHFFQLITVALEIS